MEPGIRQAEKDWHEAHFEAKRGRDLVVADAIRRRYNSPPKRPRFHLEHVFSVLGDVCGKRILYYGCGDDNSTVILALKGAEVFAFDLSERAVRLQRDMARANGVAERVHLMVCAAEEFPFRGESFDIVVGIAILHHIPDHVARVPTQVASVLSPGGLAVFVEPVIRSRVVGRILRLLPLHDEISPGERQLTADDLRHFDAFFESRPAYFCVLSRLDRFICRAPLEASAPARRILVQALHAFDYVLLKIPYADRFAAVAVLEMKRKADAKKPPLSLHAGAAS